MRQSLARFQARYSLLLVPQVKPDDPSSPLVQRLGQLSVRYQLYNIVVGGYGRARTCLTIGGLDIGIERLHVTDEPRHGTLGQALGLLVLNLFFSQQQHELLHTVGEHTGLVDIATIQFVVRHVVQRPKQSSSSPWVIGRLIQIFHGHFISLTQLAILPQFINQFKTHSVQLFMAGIPNATSAIIPNNSQIYGKNPESAQKVHKFVLRVFE